GPTLPPTHSATAWRSAPEGCGPPPRAPCWQVSVSAVCMVSGKSGRVLRAYGGLGSNPGQEATDGENYPNGDGRARPAALAAAVSLPVPAPLGQHRRQADPLCRRGIRTGAVADKRRSVVVHVPRRDRAPA